MAVTRSTFPANDKLRSSPGLVPWAILRLIAFAVFIAMVWLLIKAPHLGLTVFWGVLVPSVPLLLVFAPGFWRQVCPLAFANQLPRMTGLSFGLTLPNFLRDYTYAGAVIALVVAVALRPVLFNESGLATAGLLTGA